MVFLGQILLALSIFKETITSKMLLSKKLKRCHSECETFGGKWPFVGTVVLWGRRSERAISDQVEQKNDSTKMLHLL